MLFALLDTCYTRYLIKFLLANDSDISDVVASDPEFSTPSKKSGAARGARRKKKLEAVVVPVASWSLAVLGPKVNDIITELKGVDERKVYENVRCWLDEWYTVDEAYVRILFLEGQLWRLPQLKRVVISWPVLLVFYSTAQPYMPTRIDPVSIRLGLSPDPVQLPIYSSYSLSMSLILLRPFCFTQFVATLFSTSPTHKLSHHPEHHVPRRTAYILNTGGSIWGLDWCPKPAASVGDPHVQYLAVGGYVGTTDEHHAIGERTGGKGALQVWKIDSRLGRWVSGCAEVRGRNSDGVYERRDILRYGTFDLSFPHLHAPSADQEESRRPTLQLCILHDYGCVWDMKWCPYGTYEVSDTICIYTLSKTQYSQKNCRSPTYCRHSRNR